VKAAVALWARSEIARRWRALVALGILAGLVGGLAVASVAGARRTATSYERYREATGRADAIVFGTLAGIFPADYTAVRNLPEVDDAGEFTLTPIGVEGFPTLGQLAPNDDRLYRTIARPLLVAGRLPDPRRADEMVVNRSAAKRLGLGVGDRARVLSATALDATAPLGTGPSVDVTVVGIGDSAMELVFGGDGEPAFFPSAAVLGDHPEIPRAGNLVVRLRPGTDVAEFGRRAAEAMGVPYLPVRDLAEDTKRIRQGTDLERTALLLFAAAVSVAGIVLVGQALTRTVYALEQPASALRALGFTRNGLLAGLVLPLSLTAATGAVTALGAALGLSRWFPVGLAGRLEPDRGVHADWVVVLPGAAVIAVVVVAGAALSALRATGSRTRGAVAAGRSPLVALGRVAAAPLPAVIGARLALERGDGDRALPVRPAMAGAVAAVLGVVGAFGLLHGIDDALARPERSGQFWHAEMLPAGGHTSEEVAAAVAADDQVSDIYIVRSSDVDLDGVGTTVYSLAPLRGGRTFTVLDGRPPATAEEVALGPATARALGKGIGDTVVVDGDDRHELRVVGKALLPQTPHFSFDQGAWMSVDGLEAAAAPSDGARDETILARFEPGVAAEAGIARLQERLGPTAEISPAGLPQDVALLRNVRTLPKALAAFLVLLGLGALGHVLATAVRRRRHDLAVLRALGFRPLQVGACVAWQAVTVSLVALVGGIPVGVAAGRWSWRWVADATPLLYAPPVAAAVVLVSIPAALALAGVMATLPARRAARLRPAEVLRAE
jgi:ABC-type lipoprotein release transport system permease subunit